MSDARHLGHWFLVCIFVAAACTDNRETTVSPELMGEEPVTASAEIDARPPTPPLNDMTILPNDSARDGSLSALDLGTRMDQGVDVDMDKNEPDAVQAMHFDMGPDAESDNSTTCAIDVERCASLSAYWSGNSTRYPIILVHGFMGWDERWWLEYFYDVAETLHEDGFSVFAAALDPVASSEVRSRQLLTFVDDVRTCLCAEKVNLLGHSQGGLDARMLVGPLNRADSVASITTIASPHLGFQLADDVIANRGLGPRFLDALAILASTVFLGPAEDQADFRATLNSMTIESRRIYNETYPDPPSVPIYSYAGFTGVLSDGGSVCQSGERASPNRGDRVEPALLAMYGILGGPRTANDGIVPTAACVWGRFMGCLAADHFDQIGQVSGLSDRFNFREFYREHAAFLASEGH